MPHKAATPTSSPSTPGPTVVTTSHSPLDVPPYAELWCLSSFSFLRGASAPEELVERARQLGYGALR